MQVLPMLTKQIAYLQCILCVSALSLWRQIIFHSSTCIIFHMNVYRNRVINEKNVLLSFGLSIHMKLRMPEGSVYKLYFKKHDEFSMLFLC